MIPALALNLWSYLNRHRWTLPALLLLAGAGLRLLWLTLRDAPAITYGEAGNVAVAYAEHGTISDVFGRGSGHTAHLNPILPFVAGTIYRVFGVHSPLSELILASLSIGYILSAAALLYIAFRLIGVSRNTRLVALGGFCFIPVNLNLEVIEFKIWEGGLATCLSALALVLTLRQDRTTVTTRSFIALSFVAALLFFINPPLGLAAYAGTLVLLFWKVEFRRWPSKAFIGTAMLIAVLTPWSIRNYQVFGEFIPLRSNAGLELALANHPGAASGDDAKAVFLKRIYTIHPTCSPGAFNRMRASESEADYAQDLGRRTKEWIFDHPVDFLKLSSLHLLDFYFPPIWHWTVYGDEGRAVTLKLALMWLVSLLGLAGVIAAAIWWRGRFVYAIIVIIVPALPYAIVQPILRYHYLVYGPLVFLGAEFLNRIVRWFSQRRTGRSSDLISGEKQSPLGTAVSTNRP